MKAKDVDISCPFSLSASTEAQHNVVKELIRSWLSHQAGGPCGNAVRGWGATKRRGLVVREQREMLPQRVRLLQRQPKGTFSL